MRFFDYAYGFAQNDNGKKVAHVCFLDHGKATGEKGHLSTSFAFIFASGMGINAGKLWKVAND